MPVKLEELRQEAYKFSVSLGYRVKPGLKKIKNKNIYFWCTKHT